MPAHAPLTRRLALGLTPLAIVAAPLAVCGAVFGGPGVATLACVAILAAAIVGVLSELTAGALAPEEPLLAMLIGMGIRGTAAAALILLAVVATSLEIKTIVVVALPLYLSLIAGEITQVAVLMGGNGVLGKKPSAAIIDANRGSL